MDNLEYRNNEALCYSDLSNLFTSYEYYEYQRSEERKSTPAMNFGNMYDTFILENDKFHEKYYLFDPEKRPEQSKGMTSKINKTWLKTLESKYKLVDADEYEDLQLMRAKLLQNPIANSLLEPGGDVQSTLFYELFGLPFKSKPDYLSIEKRQIIDLKTTRSIARRDLERSIVNYHYNIQSLLYRWAAEKIYGTKFDFAFIFQEKEPPYEPVIVRLDADWDTYTAAQIERLVKYYLDCKNGTGCKTRYNDILTINKPNYLNEIANIEEF